MHINQGNLHSFVISCVENARLSYQRQWNIIGDDKKEMGENGRFIFKLM
jgi:hypothetical protein